MLHIKKVGKTVALAWRKPAPFLTKELLWALSGALLFHALLLAFVSLTPSPQEGPFPFIAVPIAIDPLKLKLELQEEQLASIPAPPPIALPSTLPEPPFPLYPPETTRRALLKGPISQTLSHPFPPVGERALLSLRFDEKGALFWFHWLEKTSHPPLNKAIEKWVQTLKTDPQNRFYPMLLEIYD